MGGVDDTLSGVTSAKAMRTLPAQLIKQQIKINKKIK
jgi:hypothetical protein